MQSLFGEAGAIVLKKGEGRVGGAKGQKTRAVGDRMEQFYREKPV